MQCGVTRTHVPHVVHSDPYTHCRCGTPDGDVALTRVESMCCSSWEEFDYRIGEPYMLTTGIDSDKPNGSPCVILCWQYVNAKAEEAKFLKTLIQLYPHAKRLMPAWQPIHYNAAAGGASTQGQSLYDIAKTLYVAFASKHSVTLGGVPWLRVPKVAVRTPTNNPSTVALLPVAEVLLVRGTCDIASVRVQLPMVPAAVRTGASMLSATLVSNSQRLVLHNTISRDPELDDDAHNALIMIGLTRVSDMADVAITDTSVLEEYMLAPRMPLQNLAKQVYELSQGQDLCSLYHCYALGHDGGEPPNAGSEEFDVRMTQQIAAGFFTWSEEEMEALEAAEAAVL